MAQWQNILPFADHTSNRKFAREQEGFARSLSTPPDEVPRCSSMYYAYPLTLADHRGAPPDAQGNPNGKTGPHGVRTSVEWETSPAASAETTVFTWIGGSQVRPALRPAYPYVTATLFVDGVAQLEFPLGRSEVYRISQHGFVLHFEPQRFQTLVEELDRFFSPHGVAGFYRLEVPGEYLTCGKPLTLRVELALTDGSHETFFFVSPRTDALQVTQGILRDEVAQLQADMVQLKRSHEMLYAQVYPQLFPNRVQGRLGIAHQSDTRHMHPPSLTVMSDGEVVITFRDAQAHLDVNGRMMIIRSRDHGKSWSDPEVMFDLPRSDHRSAAILELANGDWVTFDYRVGGFYDADGIFIQPDITGTVPDVPSLWGAWSTDKGKSWTFTENFISSPHAANRCAEPERHPILLPSGRILLASYTTPKEMTDRFFCEITIFASDDNGRHWSYLSHMPLYQFVEGEPSLLRTQDGRIILVARSRTQECNIPDWQATGMLVQYTSEDDGLSWSEGQPTPMSSMSTPGHLLQLQDGRILCTHASRAYPASIYVTTSHDQGRSWPAEYTRIIANDIIGYDATYPTSGQMADGTIITTWYASLFGKFYLATLTYSPDELP